MAAQFNHTIVWSSDQAKSPLSQPICLAGRPRPVSAI